MKDKMTAVQWLENKLNEEEIIIYHGLFDMWIKQALEMEKQQIKDAATWGALHESGEQYYNETYKKP